MLLVQETRFRLYMCTSLEGLPDNCLLKAVNCLLNHGVRVKNIRPPVILIFDAPVFFWFSEFW